ncbi:NADP-dependent oxidoreductase [Actinomadura sp. SCN-SB]|uniref:NADP-dependent oxidoreductase n=1 Tax=Actinomadura sp. SCN-SB TaxID=3373092 RepID=UPI0037539ECE
MRTGREWQLVRRPEGTPCDDDVRLVEVDVPDPVPGEVLVRNTVMSVEPYMRGRMSDRPSYAEPYTLGAPMTGHAVGEVIASKAEGIPVGTRVRHERGWREYALVPADEAESVGGEGGIVPSAYLGALGLTGMTAYVGLLGIGRCRPGDTVLVSAAAGAVGATAGQIAKAMGCTVIGSAGSPEKVRFLTEELGFDAAFSHRAPSLRDALGEALERAGVGVGRGFTGGDGDRGGGGVDVYFDNVGGAQLEAAIRVMRTFGRIVLCGAISVYNATEPVPGPRNLLLMIWRRLRMEGFLLGDHEDRRADFERDMTRWLRDGTVRNVETTASGGIDAAWPAFLALLRGDNIGKTIVRLDEAG